MQQHERLPHSQDLPQISIPPYITDFFSANTSNFTNPTWENPEENYHQTEIYLATEVTTLEEDGLQNYGQTYAILAEDLSPALEERVYRDLLITAGQPVFALETRDEQEQPAQQDRESVRQWGELCIFWAREYMAASFEKPSQNIVSVAIVAANLCRIQAIHFATSPEQRELLLTEAEAHLLNAQSFIADGPEAKRLLIIELRKMAATRFVVAQTIGNAADMAYWGGIWDPEYTKKELKAQRDILDRKASQIYTDAKRLTTPLEQKASWEKAYEIMERALATYEDPEERTYGLLFLSTIGETIGRVSEGVEKKKWFTKVYKIEKKFIDYIEQEEHSESDHRYIPTLRRMINTSMELDILGKDGEKEGNLRDISIGIQKKIIDILEKQGSKKNESTYVDELSNLIAMSAHYSKYTIVPAEQSHWLEEAYAGQQNLITYYEKTNQTNTVTYYKELYSACSNTIRLGKNSQSIGALEAEQHWTEETYSLNKKMVSLLSQRAHPSSTSYYLQEVNSLIRTLEHKKWLVESKEEKIDLMQEAYDTRITAIQEVSERGDIEAELEQRRLLLENNFKNTTGISYKELPIWALRHVDAQISYAKKLLDTEGNAAQAEMLFEKITPLLYNINADSLIENSEAKERIESLFSILKNAEEVAISLNNKSLHHRIRNLMRSVFYKGIVTVVFKNKP